MATVSNKELINTLRLQSGIDQSKYLGSWRCIDCSCNSSGVVISDNQGKCSCGSKLVYRFI